VNCSITVILSFLQGCIGSSTPSTLKGYYSVTVSAFHSEVNSKSVGMNDLAVMFLQGAMWLYYFLKKVVSP